MFFGNFVKPRRSEKKSPDTTGDFDGRYKSVDVFVLINSEETAFGNPAFDRCKPNQAEAALGGTFLYITDNFVLNPCATTEVCYLEAYVWTNCFPVHGFAELGYCRIRRSAAMPRARLAHRRLQPHPGGSHADVHH